MPLLGVYDIISNTMSVRVIYLRVCCLSESKGGILLTEINKDPRKDE